MELDGPVSHVEGVHHDGSENPASENGLNLDQSATFMREPQPYLVRTVDLPAKLNPSVRSPRSRRSLSSPSDSGTEADDERGTFVKALPAPPLRLRKGLRLAETPTLDADSHTLPTIIRSSRTKSDKARISGSTQSKGWNAGQRLNEDPGGKALDQPALKRRKEIIRRSTETVLCVGIALLLLRQGYLRKLLFSHTKEVSSYLAVIAVLLTLYPIRILARRMRAHDWPSHLAETIRIPTSFDPAPLIYPPFLPILVAIALAPKNSSTILANLVLCLSALPPPLIPSFGLTHFNTLHWFLSILPMIPLFEASPSSLHEGAMRSDSEKPPLSPETITLLYPLHCTLLVLLSALTTTSLLISELQLLSIGLINILLFSASPPAVILSILLWTGGTGIFVLCSDVIRWGVLIARIPRWRFRRAIGIIRAQQGFLASLARTIGDGKVTTALGEDSSDTEDELKITVAKSIIKVDSMKTELVRSIRNTIYGDDAEEPGSRSAVDVPAKSAVTLDNTVRGRRRRYTLPSFTIATDSVNSLINRRRRLHSISTPKYFLSLTHEQARLRKWLYAGYVYLVALVLILGPIRYLIAKYALDGHDPFGWAIGYLFGNIRPIRFQVFNWGLTNWILLPPLPEHNSIIPSTWRSGSAEHIRQVYLGAANTRLVIAGYCLLTLTTGLAIVLALPARVEVDTRRKVFHGIMVAMLLPTIPIDPSFIALALALILAIFLLLDLLRASQLPPLSRPLARFLTPYVDGRDLKGPVVISHIFLLIGCAIPLWLSLAAAETGGSDPWRGWEIKGRDVSMVSGVICVGMGDAAASLVGRRIGRRKWPWGGGKSLEGSLAFASAVTLGLLISKWYLWFGGWEAEIISIDRPRLLTGLSMTLVKSTIAASGASLMEAVLTGGNDNVVVPVVLWLLVRGLDL